MECRQETTRVCDEMPTVSLNSPSEKVAKTPNGLPVRDPAKQTKHHNLPPALQRCQLPRQKSYQVGDALFQESSLNAIVARKQGRVMEAGTP